MINTRLLCLASAMTLSLLSACASQGSAVQRYVLPTQDATEHAVTTADAAPLQVAAPRLSGLVDRRGLLMQINEIKIQEASQHQWADDLSTQLQQRLRQQLAETLTQWQLVPNLHHGDSARLLLSVQQFQGRYDGQAIISGDWQLLDSSGQLIDSAHYWLAEPLQEKGYEALVYSLDKAWLRLAAQIASRLESVGNGL